MKVLAFDTVMNSCSVACWDSGSQTLFKQSKDMARGHAEALMPMIEEVLEEAGWAYEDIDLIGVTRGPGAFTGLRIALSTARALGLSLSKPVIGVTNFDVIHHSFCKKNDIAGAVCILLETKRDDYYVALYEKDGEIISMGVKPGENILDLIVEHDIRAVTGDAVDRYLEAHQNALPEGCHAQSIKTIDVINLVECCVELYGQNASVDQVLPLYLRGADISFPKKKPRKLKVL